MSSSSDGAQGEGKATTSISSETAQTSEGKATVSSSSGTAQRSSSGKETMSGTAERSSSGKAPGTAAPPAAAANKTKTKVTTSKQMKKVVRGVVMSQEQIDGLTRYKPTYFQEDAIPKVSKERLAQTNLADKGSLPVSLDKMDDYIANIFRQLNKLEERFMKQRDRILNDYYTNGYAVVEEVAAATTPAPCRRRSRHGVTKQAAAGTTKKLN